MCLLMLLTGCLLMMAGELLAGQVPVSSPCFAICVATMWLQALPSIYSTWVKAAHTDIDFGEQLLHTPSP